MELSAIHGAEPRKCSAGGAWVDLGWQAPGQWLVTFLISTKGGKLAGPWGMPASPGRGSPLQEMI